MHLKLKLILLVVARMVELRHCSVPSPIEISWRLLDGISVYLMVVYQVKYHS